MFFSKLAVAATFAATLFGSAIVSAEPVEAIAYITGTNTADNSVVLGTVKFSQSDYHSPTKIVANITGLTEGNHGIHIHTFGDLSKGCNSTGTHYNPFNRTHGDIENKHRHAGDLGNIKAESDGSAYFDVSSDLVYLSGKFSVVGRAVVIHSGEDDLGLGGTPLSNTTGNSGDRWACGVIGFASPV
ncbi:copper/zinc superoxide dismutase [Blakeslea trispora]|nr:copper/zinc superoxide dismutase [Blakeslea trispora]